MYKIKIECSKNTSVYSKQITTRDYFVTFKDSSVIIIIIIWKVSVYKITILYLQ